MKPRKTKNHIKQYTRHSQKNYLKKAVGKTEMEHTINRYIGHERGNYKNVLDRKTTSIIFKARTI